MSEFLMEPFRIKAVEPIGRTTRWEREAILEQAGYNLFKVPASAVTIDLLTDSGTGSLSADQWAAMSRGDESYAGGASFKRFQEAVLDIFGFEQVFPTHQGRASERILASTLCRPGHTVPSNTHFDTTRANIEATGATAVDLPCAASERLASEDPFKGDMDLQALERLLLEHPGQVPFAMLTITNNGGGGQPVAMDNLRRTAELCHRHGVALYLDACRFAENAYLIQQRTPGMAHRPLIDIAREMFSLADGCIMSAKKDGMSHIGGFLCTRDPDVARAFQELLILTEGFPTYGGLAGRDLESIAIGLYEALDGDYQAYRHGMTSYLGEGLAVAGVPVLRPFGGHAIYIDARSTLPHLRRRDFPGQALVVELYRSGGIRAVEIGSVMFGGRDAVTGEETFASRDLVRLALPRRVYTRSHLDYVVATIADVMSRHEEIPGLKIIEQSQRLRHFSAVFAPVETRQPAALPLG